MTTDTATSPDTTPLQIERTGGVATIRFNRPVALNAINVPMAQALLAAAQKLSADASVRAIVLCGAGKGFMAGGDLATLRQDPEGSATQLLGPLTQALAIFDQMDAPLIAQVHGVAAGAGMSVMLQADFVIAAQGTRFNLAYVNIGACCDAGASWALPRVLGLRKALEVAMLGDTLSSDDALRLNLVNQVVPADTLDATVAAFAQRLAGGPTKALGHMRRLMRASFGHTLGQQFEAETASFIDCTASNDFRTGVDVFFAKQTPSFAGN